MILVFPGSSVLNVFCPVHVFCPFSCQVVIIFLVDVWDVCVYSGSRSFTSYMHYRWLFLGSSLSKNIFVVNLGFPHCQAQTIPCKSRINERMDMKVPAPVLGIGQVFSGELPPPPF